MSPLKKDFSVTYDLVALQKSRNLYTKKKITEKNSSNFQKQFNARKAYLYVFCLGEVKLQCLQLASTTCSFSCSLATRTIQKYLFH